VQIYRDFGAKYTRVFGKIRMMENYFFIVVRGKLRVVIEQPLFLNLQVITQTKKGEPMYKLFGAAPVFTDNNCFKIQPCIVFQFLKCRMH
jgi:hypothetical protein